MWGLLYTYTDMLTLFFRKTCPYSKKVREYADSNKIKLDFKDIAEGANMKALVKKGGKEQSPYLYDSSTDMGMYESKLIITYLKEQYAKK